MKIYGTATAYVHTEIEIEDDKIYDENYIIRKLYKQFKKEGIDTSEIEYLDYNFG